MANQHNYPLIGQAFIGSKILSANFALSGTDSGKGFTNASATGSITVTLPKSAPGLIYQFLVVAAQSIVVQPQGVDTIRGNAIGVATTLAGTPGNFLYLECLTTGFWEVLELQTTGGGGGPTGLANPTALVGLTAINGTATTAMRSDAAPALNQAIIPTWTGAHTFTPTAGVAVTINAFTGNFGLVVNGVANNAGKYAAEFIAPNSAGNSWGALVQAGTSIADTAFAVINAAATANYLFINGDGSGALGPNAPSNGLQWNTSGALTCAATAGISFSVTGVANQQTASFTSGNTAGQDFGVLITAGSTSADTAINIRNRAASAQFFEIFGDGHGTLGPTAALGLAWATTGGVTITPTATNTALTLRPADSASVGFNILDPGANLTQVRINTNNSTVVYQALGTTTQATFATSGGIALTLAATGTATFASTVQGTNFIATTVSAVGSATQIVYGSTVAATATAGAATLPTNPVGFIIVGVQGTLRKIPYYAT